MNLSRNFAVCIKGCLMGLVTLALCTDLTAGCFIRNCPPGGKRSLDIVSRAVLPCLACGPDNSGQCVGPDICCGPFGCHMGTPETEICQKENDRRQPCEINGKSCGVRGQGNCVADNICCDSGACSMNEHCKKSGSQLYVLLNKILEAENMDYSEQNVIN